MSPVRDPWRHVDADDPLVADFLAGTVEAVADLGGWLHPSLRFVARTGQAHAESEAGAGELLLRVPARAFLPISRMTWAARGLAYEVPEGMLTGEQWELLVLQVAFHEARDATGWLAATHPALAPLDDAVIDAVRAFRPSFRHALPSAASLLWSTRALRVAVGDREAEPMAVPLLDLLDHRRGGSVPTWTGDGFEVTSAGPGPAWLDYGLERDAIGMAVVYGFADGSCQVAHASPMEVEVGGRQVVVEARGRLRDGTLLAPVVREVDGALRISHLPFRPGGGDALAATIGSRAVVEAIVETDVARCHALLDAVDGSVAAGILADAVSVHLAVLASR